jgi:hypothetical protein
MANAVQPQFTFANQSGPIPLAELDTNYLAITAAINSFATYGNFLVDSSGAANSITVTTPGNTTYSYTAGTPLQVQVANTTTISAVQINVNGLGSKTVINADGTALLAGEIVQNQICQFIYDGTSMRLVSSGASGATYSYAKLTVGAPTSGVALTVNGLAGQVVAAFVSGSSGTTTVPDVNIARAGSTINSLAQGPNIELNDSTNATLSLLQQSGGQTELWQNNGAWNQVWKVTTARGFVVNPPASGNAISATGVSGAGVITATGVAGSASIFNAIGVAGLDTQIAIGIPTVAGYIMGYNGTGAANSVGAPAGANYLGTALNQSIAFCTSGGARTVINGSGTLQSVDDGNTLQTVGWRDLPPTNIAGNYTTISADRGKMIINTGSGANVAIASNAAIAYPIGAALTFFNNTGGNMTISINTDTMILAGSPGTTGTRTLASGGLATAVKYLTTNWVISGSGLT